MALRIRKNGDVVCAAQTFEKEGDFYIDDPAHYALAHYFTNGFKDRGAVGPHDEAWAELFERCLETHEDPRLYWDTENCCPLNVDSRGVELAQLPAKT